MVLETIVVKMIELIGYDSNETPYGHVVFRQGFCAARGLAHGVQYAKDIKPGFRDFGRVIGLLPL